MPYQKTYSMIKPDGVSQKHIGEIISRFENAGLDVLALEMTTITKAQAELNYQALKDKHYYPELIDYITSGPVVKMIIGGNNAILKVRQLMGATNPLDAYPGSIRGDFGLDETKNIIHGSDSPEAAQRELEIFFDHLVSQTGK